MQPQVTFEMAPPMPRLWFVNEAETELLQIQTNRFIHNWRKGEKGGDYPRYKLLRQKLHEELELFTAFLKTEGIGDLRANQCELTYINQIVAGEGWQKHGEVDKILTTWRPGYSESFLPPAEAVSVASRYVIPGAQSEPVGRLHITVAPSFRSSDSRPTLLLQLVARGAPQGETLEAVFQFLDKSHEWAVKGFTSITTPLMHGIWERQS